MGGFEVREGDRIVLDASWPNRKAASLLKFVAVSGGSVHREQVFEALWPRLDPEAAANNLRKCLHQLRTVLNGSVDGQFLSIRGGLVILDSAIQIDINTFRSLAEAARQTKDLGAYERAIAAYGGDLLPEERYEPWTEPLRTQLQTLYVDLLFELAAFQADSRDYPAAVESLRWLLALDSVDEKAHRALMTVFATAGQPARALQQYQMCRDVLRRELDVSPSDETEALRQAIIDGKLSAEAPARDAEPPIRGAVTARAGRSWFRETRFLLGGAIALLALLGGLVAMLAFAEEEGDASPEFETVQFQFQSTSESTPAGGDCETEDTVYLTTVEGDISGGITGEIVSEGNTRLSAVDDCERGGGEATWTITDSQGNTLSGTAQISLQLVRLTAGSATSASSAMVITEGTGIYEGIGGRGRCDDQAYSERHPNGSVTATSESECEFNLVRIHDLAEASSPLLISLGASGTDISAADSGSSTPDTIGLVVLYRNAADSPLEGMTMTLLSPEGAHLAAVPAGDSAGAATVENDLTWRVPDAPSDTIERFDLDVELLEASGDALEVVVEIDCETCGDPVRTRPLQLEITQ
jgi:DNA-binding SARP family transcriptional activator